METTWGTGSSCESILSSDFECKLNCYVQMERIYQMNVVPDILPEMHPSFDLRLSFPEPPPRNTLLRTRTARRYLPVEPGVFLLPEQV